MRLLHVAFLFNAYICLNPITNQYIPQFPYYTVKNSMAYIPLTKNSIKINICFEYPFDATLRKHAYSNILKISPTKYENCDIFHISAQNIDCGYSQNIDCG